VQGIGDYLGEVGSIGISARQKDWLSKLERQIAGGREILKESSKSEMDTLNQLFWNWVRTEELKAWYGEPEKKSLFQGTSVTALTIPGEFETPLDLKGMEKLEEAIADSFIENHRRYESQIRGAIVENVDHWMSEGAFYGFAIASKVISQALGLTVPNGDVVFDVDGFTVDPHEITTYPDEVRYAYFETCLDRLTCFDGVELLVRELESSLVLADISKPNLAVYEDQLMLAPVRCNEICSLISRHVTDLIRDKTGGEISPRSLMVTIFDTDTPNTYHQINGYYGKTTAPMLPGITLLGASGGIEAFRWLYAYRVGLVSQKIMKSSLYSQVNNSFVPFVFYGVLVERDAEILLDLDNLDLLRYRGQISPYIEYLYLLPKLKNYLKATSDRDLSEDLNNIRL